MIDAAENMITNCDMRSYYGVGSPSPMPFELNIERHNLTDGNILKAFALLGFGEIKEANETIESAEKIEPNDFRIYAFKEILPTISK